MNAGFTLIEFVMVIVIAGLLSTIVFRALVLPLHAFEDLSRRTELVSIAESALMQMSRDLGSAVPNSVRVVQSGNIVSLELLHASARGRYRYTSDVLDRDDTALSPQSADSAFNVLGSIGSLSADSRIVVNSESADKLYAAAVSGTGGIITPATTKISVTEVVIDSQNNAQKKVGVEQSISLSSAFQFDPKGRGFLQKWFYVNDTPITYRCDLSTHAVHRYVNYPVSAVQTTAIPKTTDSNLLVNSVTDCQFLYKKNSPTAAGVATLLLTLSEAKSTITSAAQNKESISVMRQVQVSNEL